MEITTTQKFIHSSPRKLRLVADMVRKMTPVRAVDILKFTPKSAAFDLSLAIRSAIASAKQRGLEEATISFKALEVNEGPKMRRFRAGSKGRALPFKRRMAHIKIVLSDSTKAKIEKTEKEIG